MRGAETGLRGIQRNWRFGLVLLCQRLEVYFFIEKSMQNYNLIYEIAENANKIRFDMSIYMTF